MNITGKEKITSEKDDWKMKKKEKKYPTYAWKHHSNPEKQTLLLIVSKRRRMILSCNKNLSALLKGITFKHNGDFYCLNCVYSFSTENKRQSHKKYVKMKIFVTL